MGRENQLTFEQLKQRFFSNSDSMRDQKLEALYRQITAADDSINAEQFVGLIDQLTSCLQNERLRCDCALLLGKLYLGEMKGDTLLPVAIERLNSDRTRLAAYYLRCGMEYGDERCARLFCEAKVKSLGCLSQQPNAWEGQKGAIRAILEDHNIGENCKRLVRSISLQKKSIVEGHNSNGPFFSKHEEKGDASSPSTDCLDSLQPF